MLLMRYGLSIEDIVAGSAAVLLLINALKGLAPAAFEGRWKAALGLAVGLLYGLAVWNPEWGKVAVGGLLCTLGAIGGWESLKAIAHKVGQPKTL
jgi:hypothetical protein